MCVYLCRVNTQRLALSLSFFVCRFVFYWELPERYSHQSYGVLLLETNWLRLNLEKELRSIIGLLLQISNIHAPYSEILHDLVTL
jgi:hypothetical protein